MQLRSPLAALLFLAVATPLPAAAPIALFNGRTCRLTPYLWNPKPRPRTTTPASDVGPSRTAS
jgi:hypothetical protein